MLGKLKSAIGDGAVQKAVDTIAPSLQPHLDKLTELSPDLVQNDDSYTQKFIDPTWLAISASSGGVLNMVPKAKEKFQKAMIHLRNELLIFDGNSVKVADDASSRLPTVLLEGFKQ